VRVIRYRRVCAPGCALQGLQVHTVRARGLRCSIQRTYLIVAHAFLLGAALVVFVLLLGRHVLDTGSIVAILLRSAASNTLYLTKD
jgi:hypothetical protein